MVAGMLLLGVMALRPQQDASAAVLEAVQGLSTATDDAFHDDELTLDETAQLRLRAASLLDEIGGGDEALSGLSADELTAVVARLDAVLHRLSIYRAEREDSDGELEDAEHSVRQAATAVNEERDRRGDLDGGDDRSGSSGFDGAGEDDDDDLPRSTAAPSASPVGGAATAAPTATPVGEPDDGEHEDEHEDDGHEPASPSVTAEELSPSPPPSASPATPAPSVAALPPNSSMQVEAAAGEYSYPVSDAGTVRFEFDGHETLEVLAATPSPGWAATVEEPDGSEIRVTFTRDGLRARFEAAREDGRIEISIRWER
jgi:hypothetical protein